MNGNGLDKIQKVCKILHSLTNWIHLDQNCVRVLSEDRIYIPKIDDLGSYLQVECIPVSYDTNYDDSVSTKRTGEPYKIKIGLYSCIVV